MRNRESSGLRRRGDASECTTGSLEPDEWFGGARGWLGGEEIIMEGLRRTIP